MNMLITASGAWNLKEFQQTNAMLVSTHLRRQTSDLMHMLDISKTDGDIRDKDVHLPDRCLNFLNNLFPTNKIPGGLHFITGKGKAKEPIDMNTKCFRCKQGK